MSTVIQLLDKSGIPEQPFACSRRTTEPCKILLLLRKDYASRLSDIAKREPYEQAHKPIGLHL